MLYCLSSYVSCLNVLAICAKGYGLMLISSMNLDSWKEIQPVKSATSICIRSSKSVFLVGV